MNHKKKDPGQGILPKAKHVKFNEQQRHINGHRLVSQELVRVNQGLTRYVTRAAAVARDIENGRSSPSANKIAEIQRRLSQTLVSLQGKVAEHAQ